MTVRDTWLWVVAALLTIVFVAIVIAVMRG